MYGCMNVCDIEDMEGERVADLFNVRKLIK
jgi:hypothetical protein